MSAKSKNLNKARSVKNDEFYTQFIDVQNELAYYEKCFCGKIVYCNCDTIESAFWVYFHLNFSRLGLKKLVSTYYNRDGVSYKNEYLGGDDLNIGACVRTLLKCDGDFRSDDCLEMLDECDIVVTNPPFSLFRDYVAMMMKHEKKFLVIGSLNAITYKEFFPLLKNNKVWLGYTKVKEFLQADGSVKKFGNVGWFTNLDISKRHDAIILQKKYMPSKYLRYDNYDSINVDKISDIPYDYDGVMGVPITFLDKYNPEQFEILGYTGGVGWNEQNDIKTSKVYIDCKQHNPDGSITNGSKVNTGATILCDYVPNQRYYTALNGEGCLLRVYGRILIRRRGN